MKRTTSITENQFEQLTQMIWQELLSATDGGRVVALTQRDQVRLTLTYLRANVTQAFLGEMFGVSQATASRVITTMTPILGRLLKDFVPDPEAASKGTTLLVDGSLTRIRELDGGGVVSLTWRCPPSWENGVYDNNQSRNRRALT